MYLSISYQLHSLLYIYLLFYPYLIYSFININLIQYIFFIILILIQYINISNIIQYTILIKYIAYYSFDIFYLHLYNYQKARHLLLFIIDIFFNIIYYQSLSLYSPLIYLYQFSLFLLSIHT